MRILTEEDTNERGYPQMASVWGAMDGATKDGSAPTMNKWEISNEDTHEGGY